jgi:hypothetical protein
VEEEEGTPVSFSFTAIQIVNRFLEVFAMKQSTRRILAIGELFADDAKMSSLKNSEKVYLDGAEQISNSFLLADPRESKLSKRIFIDMAPSELGNSGSSSITFCLDFHRAGTSPGLGDVSKPTVLLYRCDAKHITSVWGMVDKEAIADRSEDLSFEQLNDMSVWSLVLPHILLDIPHLMEEEETARAAAPGGAGAGAGPGPRMHFHNYDKIDVWG